MSVWIEQCADQSYDNRVMVSRSYQCGCYFCLSVFPAESIVEWTDGDVTAMCPHCDIDSVLPDAAGFPMDIEFLAAAKERWFTGRAA